MNTIEQIIMNNEDAVPCHPAETGDLGSGPGGGRCAWPSREKPKRKEFQIVIKPNNGLR
jgi:hypothetical protein